MIEKIVKYTLIMLLLLPAKMSMAIIDEDNENVQVNQNILIEHSDENGPEVEFRQANQLYTEGNFEEAISLYEKIINTGYHSAPLYYNLGNAYYRSNNIPAAILNYERALLLSPGDEDISFNLELARTHVRDRIETLPRFFMNRWWTEVRDLLSAERWATLSVVSFIAALFMLAGFFVASTPGIRKLFFWFSICVFIISVFGFALGLDQRNNLRNHDSAIIFSPVVSVKSSPDNNSSDLFVVHEGTKVWVNDSIGDWLSVELSDGNTGWVKKEALEMI